jgi:tetratricopeptide (TPR) repeat protein
MRAEKRLHLLFWRSLLLVAVLATVAVAQDNPGSQPVTSTTKVDNEAKSTAGRTPYVLAMETYRGGDYKEALSKFEAAAQAGGDDAAAAYAWLARLQLQLHNPEQAEVSAKKALELNKELPTAQSAMGEVFYRQARFAEAQDVFRKIVLADKPDPRAYLGLAKIHWANANYKSAKQVLDHAFNFDRQDPEIFWRWYRTLDQSARMEALKSQLALASSADSKQSSYLKRAIQMLEETDKRPAGPCKLTSNANSTDMKLEMLLRGANRLGGYALPIKVNAAKAMLAVDTGAGGIIISSHVAQRAGLQKFSENRIGGIGDDGPSKGYVGFAEKIVVGDLQFANCYVQVVEHLRFPDEDGLIGTNIFEDFLVDLDLSHKQFRLSPLEPVPDTIPSDLALHSAMPINTNDHNRFVPEKYANFEKVYRVGRDLLLPTRVNDSPPKLFILDTGGWDNVISLPLARQTTKLHAEGAAKVSGLSGEVRETYKTDEVDLTFGNFRQHRHDLVSFDLKGLSEDAGTEVSGVLGFAMLWLMEIKIDYRDHLVGLQVNLNLPH